MRMPFAKQISWYLVFAMFIIGIAPRLDAAIAPSEVIASSQFDRAADLTEIQRVLEMKVVKERLEKLGFTTDEIKARFDSLSDHQIHQLAQQIDDLRVGKDEALGVIIALLVIVVLIIVILQLTGRRVIVTK
ncbi:MAG: PA2779 family protein [Nitrospirae bacterium]|nr:PA2779 family protein [Nitrospirota bacterium]